MAGNLFSGRKAWFSKSVPQDLKNVWLNEKGKIVPTISSADLIFTRDPRAADIKWFYNTKLFLEQGVMPFSSLWLRDTTQNLVDFILYPNGLKDSYPTFPKEWQFVDEEESSLQYHQFHSSMHDGFIHVEDLMIPEDVHLTDFQAPDYQVFLEDAP